jgi:hypothetical protein
VIPFGLELLPWADLERPVDDVACVVLVPVVGDDAPLADQALVQNGARVGGHDVEGRRLETSRDRPLNGAVEDVGAIVVEAEHEAAVHHHAGSIKKRSSYLTSGPSPTRRPKELTRDPRK